MDPLSVIASTIAIVQATVATYKTIEKLKGLPKEFVEVGLRFPLAQDSLRLLRNQIETQTLDEASHKAIEPCLTGCEANAKKLRDIFNNIEKAAANNSSMLDMYRTALLRLGKAHRVESLMNGILADLNALVTNQLFRGDATTKRVAVQLEEAIEQLSDLASSVSDEELDSPQGFCQVIESGGTGHQTQYNNYGSGTNYNISGGSHTIHFGPSNKERVLEALNTSPYRARMNRNPKRTPGTCEWFEYHSDFKQWKSSQSSSMLWVSADPGCGKSVLARYLVESVLQTHGSQNVCYFFFKDDFEDQKTATSAICCILHQLFTRRRDLFSEEIAQRLDAHRAHLASSFDEVWDALISTSQQENAGEIVCVLDAFDECVDDERRKLSANLRSFYDPGNEVKKKTTLKFLVTSRPYDKIRRGFEPLNMPGLPVIHLKGESEEELTKIAREINIYIKSEISEMDHLSPREKDLLQQKLQGIQNRTYLWVYLAIEWMKDETINKISSKDIISTLPTTVDQAYEAILAKSTNSKEARKLLHIIVATTRPLTLAEMDLALNLAPDASLGNYIPDWDRDEEDRYGKYIRNLCGLFVNIVDSKIYLLHQTAKEFLVSKPDPVAERSSFGSVKPVWKSTFDIIESHSIVYNICHWYLHSRDGSASEGRAYDFFQYCAVNWPIHFRAAHAKHNAMVIESARALCNTSIQRFGMWFDVYWAAMQVGHVPRFTVITVASFFGLEQIVQLELASGDADVNVRDDIYQRSPLSWAAENGFDNIVKLLLKGPKANLRQAITKPWAFGKGARIDIKDGYNRGAQVDAKDRYNRTPLSYAAWNGHLQVVRRLMQANASINTLDDLNATPLYYALCTGNMDVISEMSKGVYIGDAHDIRNRLLCSAAKTGQARVVKMLLETGADLETRDANRNTPLLAAILGMHVAVVRLLLDKGANMESRNASGVLPLELAIELEFSPIVELLLDKGADIESKLTAGVSPLQFAIIVGFLPMVELLLQRGADVEGTINRRERVEGQARKKPSLGVERPILLVCGLGRQRNINILRLLLDNGANIEARDGRAGATPLWWAVRYCMEEETQLLLSRNADVTSRDVWGNRPLHLANMSIAQQLLAKGAWINVANHAGETALYRAAMNGKVATVKVLLKHGAQVDIKAHNKWTALMAAVAKHRHYVIEVLLIHGAQVDIQDGHGQTALLLAVRFGCKDITRKLLSYGAAVDYQDPKGQTALSLAIVLARGETESKRGEILKILLEYTAGTEVEDSLQPASSHVGGTSASSSRNSYI